MHMFVCSYMPLIIYFVNVHTKFCYIWLELYKLTDENLSVHAQLKQRMNRLNFVIIKAP